MSADLPSPEMSAGARGSALRIFELDDQKLEAKNYT